MTLEQRIHKLERHIATMPALPVTVSKVVEIANSPDTSPVDLNKIISLDPVLMARVLKLINSAYYGLNTKVNSLVRAIIMLGINTVKNLALSSSVLDRLGDHSQFQALDPQGFWRHSLAVGVISKLIARKRGVPSAKLEEYFIAGLLHGIGKIPMNNVLSDEYVTAMGIADRNRISLYSAELKVFGFDNTFVGVKIGEAWSLGNAILDTIKFQNRPEEYTGSYDDIVNTTHVAIYFAGLAEIGFSGDRYPARAKDHSLEKLGIETGYLDEIESEVEQEIEKAEVFLRL
ncbi:MAG: HDOD domain-containing protein [Spirochaetales bacterium]